MNDKEVRLLLTRKAKICLRKMQQYQVLLESLCDTRTRYLELLLVNKAIGTIIDWGPEDVVEKGTVLLQSQDGELMVEIACVSCFRRCEGEVEFLVTNGRGKKRKTVITIPFSRFYRNLKEGSFKAYE